MVLSATTYTILCIFLSVYQGMIYWDRTIGVRKLAVFKEKKKKKPQNYKKSAVSGFAWILSKTAEQHKKITPLVS